MRRDVLTTVIVIIFLAVGASGTFAQTAFVGATLFDGTGADPVKNAVVIVMGDRILEVGVREEIEIPDYLTAVDVSGKWIVPGLIDAHIHYFQSGGLYTRPDVIDLRAWRPYEKEMAAIDAMSAVATGTSTCVRRPTNSSTRRGRRSPDRWCRPCRGRRWTSAIRRS
jgi:imidazolonepropionase-like amidohydrolase